jgi:succinate dehydrogenase / fumarate reductase, cytochrome b subunit
MTWFGNFYRSAIGRKAVMAITGVILFGWIFAHMAGNLKLFFGAEALNHYAEWLRDLGGPIFPHESALWITRILLLVAVVFHIHSAYMLTVMNRNARPTDYADREFVKGSYAARTMRWGGVIILLFIIYHLLHLTTGDVHHDFRRLPNDGADVYHNVVSGFQVWWVSAVYIVANLALGLHLYHGLWSMFSSLGLTNPRFEQLRRTFATVFAVVITAANISFPLSVLTGFVR